MFNFELLCVPDQCMIFILQSNILRKFKKIDLSFVCALEQVSLPLKVLLRFYLLYVNIKYLGLAVNTSGIQTSRK